MNYRDFIRREYSARKERNPSYSLRSFARDIGVSTSKLSEALKGMAGFSREKALRIAKGLKLSAEESKIFVELVETEHSRSKMGKNQAKARLEELKKQIQYDELDLERFKIIADWHHFALLELTEVKGFKADPRWIAKRLGISIEKVRESITLLLDFGLLKEEKATLIQTHAHLNTPTGMPSREIRHHHAQILNKALDALEKTPLQDREFHSVSFAFESSRMEDARKALKEFRLKFINEFQANGNADRVYCLTMPFFNLDQLDDEGKAR